MEAFGEGSDFGAPALGGLLRFFTELGQAGARCLGIGFADDLADVLDPPLTERLGIVRQNAGQQHIQQYAQRVDIRTRIDVFVDHLGLFGTHVLRRAQQLAVLRKERPLGQGLAHGLGHAKVDDLRCGPVVLCGDDDVRRLEVAMDDPFLVGMVDSETDLLEEAQAILNAELVAVAVVRDGRSFHVFHREIGPAGHGGAGVVDLGDVRMIQKGQSLTFGLKAGQDPPGIHPRLDHFDRDSPPDLSFLFGQKDRPHAAFAKSSKQLVPADPVAGLLQNDGDGRRSGAAGLLRPVPCGPLVPTAAHLIVRFVIGRVVPDGQQTVQLLGPQTEQRILFLHLTTPICDGLLRSIPHISLHLARAWAENVGFPPIPRPPLRPTSPIPAGTGSMPCGTGV